MEMKVTEFRICLKTPKGGEGAAIKAGYMGFSSIGIALFPKTGI